MAKKESIIDQIAVFIVLLFYNEELINFINTG